MINDSIIGEIQNFVGIYSGRYTGDTQFDAQLGIVWKKSVIDEIIDGDMIDEINMSEGMPEKTKKDRF
jgi:hypothetical protein